MKRKSRRAFAVLGLVLVPLAICASVLLVKSALTADQNPQRTSKLAFNHRATFTAVAGKPSTDTRPVNRHVRNAVKTDDSVESHASTNTNILCPEADQSWAATLGIGFDLDKQCDYAVLWGTELKGGRLGNSVEHGSHARDDSSQSSHGDASAFGGWQGTIAFSGATGAPTHARSHDPASASGFLQQIADSCAEGTCKTPTTTDGHPSQAAPGRPGKTMTPATPAATTTPPAAPVATVTVPEPGTFAMLLIGAVALLRKRRFS